MAINVERDYAELCRFGQSADEIRTLLGRVNDLTDQLTSGQLGRKDLPEDQLVRYVSELNKTKQKVSRIDLV